MINYLAKWLTFGQEQEDQLIESWQINLDSHQQVQKKCG
jgi:hypothetical protein